MNKHPFRAFLTGSYAYGIPHAGSDMDLVMHVTRADLEKLRLLADPWNYGSGEQALELNYINAGTQPLRFGKLNLICCLDEKTYDAWREATRELKRQAPVSRAFAVEYMRRMREERGIGPARTGEF